MSWRIIYINKANKLSLNLNSLQVIQNDEKYFINLYEIGAIIVEDYMSVLTSRLIIELANQGIPILFLGLNHMPVGEFLPISDNVRTAKCINEQCKWNDSVKDELWSKIIKAKICNQIITLKMVNKTEKIQLLTENLKKIQIGDKTNIEGISARIYFKELFSQEFIRFEDDVENACLNLCYHIIRTLISKEIIARGFNTTIGINHRSQYNTFNLSDDIIEVFRPIADYYVYKLLLTDEFQNINEVSKELKEKLFDIVNYKIEYDNKKYSIMNVIPYYVANVLKYMENKGKSDYFYPKLIEKNK